MPDELIGDTINSIKYLQIEPTTRCNFNCSFCCGRDMEQSDMNIETFKTALETFPSLEHIEMQGEGEPLMNPSFFTMIDIAQSYNIKTSFITNGSLLSKGAVKRVVDADINKIQISIDSADDGTFYAIRGFKLSKILHNIENLLNERTRRSLKKPAIGFSITILMRTINDLKGILKLYRSLGLDGGIAVQPLQKMDSYFRVYDDAIRSEILSESEADELWFNFYSDPEIQEIEKSRAPVYGFYDELMKGWKPTKRICPWLEKGIYINYMGFSTPCCKVKDTKHYSYGKIGARNTKNILHARNNIRDMMRTGNMPVACTGCDLARFALMTKAGFINLVLRNFRTRGCSIPWLYRLFSVNF